MMARVTESVECATPRPQSNINPVLLSTATLAAAARTLYTRIDSFTGEYKFLSLDFPCLVYFQGRFFQSARHALLAGKHPLFVDELSRITDVQELKRAAKTKAEDPEWPRYRLKWMELIQRDKFRRNTDLREKLRLSGNRELVWVNKADAFFGKIGLSRGHNHLGRILMEIRDNIIEGTELESWLVICNDVETEERSLPVIRLLERREGETSTTEIFLKGKSFYRIGKLPDNDLVALNPSVSRRHAALVVLKGGNVILVDLKSKAQTFKNGVPIEFDHVGVLMQTNDVFSLGTSTRHYLIEIDNSLVVNYLQTRSREINRELNMLSDQVAAASGANIHSTTNIFIGGLSYSTSRYELIESFQEFGSIVRCIIPQVDRTIPNDHESAYTVRGMAFIEFAEAEEAAKALQRNGFYLNGRPIFVNYAHATREYRDAEAEKETPLTEFVAATSKTLDHPTHGSLKPTLEIDPETGEPVGRKGFSLHDDRTDVYYGEAMSDRKRGNKETRRNYPEEEESKGNKKSKSRKKGNES